DDTDSSDVDNDVSSDDNSSTSSSDADSDSEMYSSSDSDSDDDSPRLPTSANTLAHAQSIASTQRANYLAEARDANYVPDTTPEDVDHYESDGDHYMSVDDYDFELSHGEYPAPLDDDATTLVNSHGAMIPDRVVLVDYDGETLAGEDMLVDRELAEPPSPAAEAWVPPALPSQVFPSVVYGDVYDHAPCGTVADAPEPTYDSMNEDSDDGPEDDLRILEDIISDEEIAREEEQLPHPSSPAAVSVSSSLPSSAPTTPMSAVFLQSPPALVPNLDNGNTDPIVTPPAAVA
ncbi:hypothetical protein GGI24_007032, partial [Coemansia furcata]